MDIETFIIEEVTTKGKKPEQVEAQALGLIDELALGGQRKLVVPSTEEEGSGTRIRYPRMKAEEEAVYKNVCSAQCLVEEYDAGILPLRILEVVKETRPLFDELWVWYPDVQDPDPILIGTRKIPGRSYGEERFLIARWGEVLVPFEELRERAIEILRKRWAAHGKAKLSEAQVFLDNLEGNLDKHLAGEYIPMP